MRSRLIDPAPARRRVLAAAGAMGATIALPAWCGAAPARSPRKVALLIGNARYNRHARLNGPVGDARLMAATVQELGFSATLLRDAGKADMAEALAGWLAAAADAEVRLIYFAGHGAQFRGRNFLLPVDALLPLWSEEDLPSVAILVDEVTDRLSRFESGVNVVVLDACRSMPVRAGSGLKGAGSPLAPGLAPGLAPRGTLVAFSTSPGMVAGDAAPAANGCYARHLAAHMRIPGLPIEAVFKRTRAAVMQESNGLQIPVESSTLVGDFCFAANAAGRCGA
jgi:uncharacterized caspase-like protein